MSEHILIAVEYSIFDQEIHFSKLKPGCPFKILLLFFAALSKDRCLFYHIPSAPGLKAGYWIFFCSQCYFWNTTFQSSYLQTKKPPVFMRWPIQLFHSAIHWVPPPSAKTVARLTFCSCRALSPVLGTLTTSSSYILASQQCSLPIFKDLVPTPS